MPSTHIQQFTTTSGGFQGSNAIANNSSQFYVDQGKTTSFATIEISGTGGSPNLLDYGTVTGLEVHIEDAQTTSGVGSTVDVALFHNTDNAYTSEIEVGSSLLGVLPSTVKVGGSTTNWGKTWSADDINNLKVKIFNPTEVTGGVALIATFVFVVVYYIPRSDETTIIFESGKINLFQGKIFI